MTDSTQAEKTAAIGPIGTAINILVSPSEAFTELAARPKILFPLALLLVSTVAVLYWYFSIIDYAWYVDDILASSNLTENQFEQARKAMLSVSQNTFILLGILGGTISIFLFYVLQACYLALVSALNGDGKQFGLWFSLVSWTALPSLLSVVGMLATLALSPDGQLSVYDLNPLRLNNLGLVSDNESLNTLFRAVDLTMLWSIGLLILGYKQLTGSGLGKAFLVIATPYLVIASAGVRWSNRSVQPS